MRIDKFINKSSKTTKKKVNQALGVKKFERVQKMIHIGKFNDKGN